MTDGPSTNPPPDSTRRIDPEVEKAARHADIPDGQLYDTDVTTTGAGSLWVLGVVLIVVAVLVGVFIVIAMHWRPGK